MVIIRTGAAKALFSARSRTRRVASTRTLLGVLGLAFAVIGIGVGWVVEPLAGMAFLIVGAFLLILPFTRPHDEE